MQPYHNRIAAPKKRSIHASQINTLYEARHGASHKTALDIAYYMCMSVLSIMCARCKRSLQCSTAAPVDAVPPTQHSCRVEGGASEPATSQGSSAHRLQQKEQSSLVAGLMDISIGTSIWHIFIIACATLHLRMAWRSCVCTCPTHAQLMHDSCACPIFRLSWHATMLVPLTSTKGECLHDHTACTHAAPGASICWAHPLTIPSVCD